MARRSPPLRAPLFSCLHQRYSAAPVPFPCAPRSALPVGFPQKHCGPNHPLWSLITFPHSRQCCRSGGIGGLGIREVKRASGSGGSNRLPGRNRSHSRRHSPIARRNQKTIRLVALAKKGRKRDAALSACQGAAARCRPDALPKQVNGAGAETSPPRSWFRG